MCMTGIPAKLWQAGDSFDPAALMQKFEDGTAFDWDDLGQLVRRTQEINPDRITADCVNGFAFLIAFAFAARCRWSRRAGDMRLAQNTSLKEPFQDSFSAMDSGAGKG